MRLEDYDASSKDRTWRGVDFGAATFDDCLMEGARFKNVDLRGVVIRGAWLSGEITGEVEHLTVNGVDVTDFVEAELDRREPDRTKMHPTDPAGFREAWDILERRWAQTFERAARLTPEQLHERVDGEWSFIETQRHLVFATDAWIRRALLGDPSPWSPLDLPHDDMADIPVGAARRDGTALARRGARAATRPDGHDATGGRRAHRRAAGRGRPHRSPSPATPSPWPIRSQRCVGASSTRSGTTTSTPSVTSPSSKVASRSDHAKGPEPQGFRAFRGYAARAAYGLAHRTVTRRRGAP